MESSMSSVHHICILYVVLKYLKCVCVCGSKTKGSCKSYVDTCSPSDKGKGRGSPALANSPAPRPQSSKKTSSAAPTQQQKKHKVSLYYTKYKSCSPTAAAGGAAMDEEQEELAIDAPLTPDLDVCNNNEPSFVSELDKKISADFKEDSHSTIDDRVPAAVMFPVEMPAGFPDNVTLGPGPRPGLFVCSPVVKTYPEHYAEKADSGKGECSEMEVGMVLKSTTFYKLMVLYGNIIMTCFFFSSWEKKKAKKRKHRRQRLALHQGIQREREVAKRQKLCPGRENFS